MIFDDGGDCCKLLGDWEGIPCVRFAPRLLSRK